MPLFDIHIIKYKAVNTMAVHFTQNMHAEHGHLI